MRMTIDNARSVIEMLQTQLEIANQPRSLAFDTAIDTMRKYQRIQAIINNAKDSDGTVKYNWLYEQIAGVAEDGNDNN